MNQRCKPGRESNKMIKLEVKSKWAKQSYGITSDKKLFKKPSFQNRPSLSKRKD
ncbi:MAG TPA: hypothetical protein VMW81_09110 [Nitrospinota bacterium]|nr:hypothetical protein [Nitrospinota bacterium]